MQNTDNRQGSDKMKAERWYIPSDEHPGMFYIFDRQDIDRARLCLLVSKDAVDKYYRHKFRLRRAETFTEYEW